MLFKAAIAITFAIVLGFAVYLVTYVGFFKPVHVSEATALPAMKLVYLDHMGAYHKIVASIEAVEKWAKENNVDCSKSFGEFIDDPDVTEEARLRSRAGCIVSDAPANLPKDFKTMEYPARRYVTATFSGAPSIGPFTVYPAVREKIEELRLKPNGSVIEQYEIHGPKEMTTTYFFPVE